MKRSVQGVGFSATTETVYFVFEPTYSYETGYLINGFFSQILSLVQEIDSLNNVQHR